MITEFGPRLSLICVMILIQSSFAQPIESPMVALQTMMSDGDEIPSLSMMRSALSEFDAWTENGQTFFKGNPANRLLYDSVLLPLSKQDSAELATEWQDRYFRNRVFTAYRSLIPFYVYEIAVAGGSLQTPRCDSLHNAVARRNNPTPELLKEARDELRELTARSKKIINEGKMPYRIDTLVVIFNALIRNKVIVDTLREANYAKLESDDRVLEVLKTRIEAAKKLSQFQVGEKRDKGKQVEEVDIISEIEWTNKRMRMNSWDPSDEAGPSGQS